MGIQGNENSFFTCYLKVVLDRFFWNLEFVVDDSVSHYSYLFILVLEITFLFIMQNRNINCLNSFENTFLYTAYADDTTFFLKDEKSVIEVMKTFDIFSTFSGLKPNKSKCKIAGLGALKGLKLALCEMQCINLNFNAVKILGVYYYYDKNSKTKKIL